GGDDRVFGRPQQHLLEHRVGDAILDHDLPAGAVRPDLGLGDGHVAELPRRELVAPVLERPLGELLDVALVHERDRVALRGDGVRDRLADEALRSELRDRLDADGGAGTNLRRGAALDGVERVDDGIRAGRIRRPLDARVHVLGVLAEDDHVHVFRLLHRRGDAVEVAHRAHAGVEVELLPQRHVERADTAADRRGEWPLDGHAIVRDLIERLLRQVIVPLRLPLVAGPDLFPGDLLLPAINFGHRAVDDVLRGAPDVGAGAVAFDVGNDGRVGDDDLAVLVVDSRSAHSAADFTQ